ncbi:MAG: DUF362 domain-containing protein [Mollicutes bacterium]|nr:DUF362 domain-containing protein [Mollicutes bacterium]
MERVYIYKCGDYNLEAKKAIDNVIDSFLVLKNIKNKKVIIKANLVSAIKPEKSVTTHYLLIKYLTEYLTSRKCKVIIGDSPGGLYNKSTLEHIYKETKMNETGAILNQNFETEKCVYKEAKVLKTFEYTSFLKEADIIINFCKLKTHGMMGMSASVKNMFGSIPGTLKPEYHYRFPNSDDFANMLIDINEYFKPHINITDAVVGMEGNGPTMGTPRKIGLIMASENPYALDYISAQIIGLDYQTVETIVQSIKRKLFDKDNIILNDDINKYIIKDFKLIKKARSMSFFKDKKGFHNKFISKAGERLFSNKPYLVSRKCVGCSKCANVCPAQAIDMVNRKPIINKSKCIKCYCCQEFCPKGAIIIKTSVLLRMIHKFRK